MLPHEVREFRMRKLFLVKRVFFHSAAFVFLAIRTGNYQQSTRLQHAPDIHHEYLMLLQMFDRLEGHYDVDRLRLDRDGTAFAGQETQVGLAILPLGVRNRFGRHIDAHHARRAGGEQRAAIAFAASDIEHGKPAHALRRKQVAMQMLVINLGIKQGRSSGKSLSGEGQIFNKSSIFQGKDAMGGESSRADREVAKFSI